jgi:23S rRNA-intervening sequence protein
MASEGFRDLKVWQDAMTLVEDVYRVTLRFPAGLSGISCVRRLP